MSIQQTVRRVLWKFGYDISRFTPISHPLARKSQMLKHYKIDTVLDIGANTGQFAAQVRQDLGFKGRILSFEPMTSAFGILASNARNDPAWEVFNCAIGDTAEKSEINISENSYSSSLLGMLPSHLKSAPESKYIGKEVIDVKTLDSIYGDLCGTAKNVFMKIDTQGFESKVLKGAERSLALIDTVQMEMSLVPLYESELLFDGMCRLMVEKGYTLIAVDSGFSDAASGQALQVDGIFHRFRS